MLLFGYIYWNYIENQSDASQNKSRNATNNEPKNTTRFKSNNSAISTNINTICNNTFGNKNGSGQSTTSSKVRNISTTNATQNSDRNITDNNNGGIMIDFKQIVEAKDILKKQQLIQQEVHKALKWVQQHAVKLGNSKCVQLNKKINALNNKFNSNDKFIAYWKHVSDVINSHEKALKVGINMTSQVTHATSVPPRTYTQNNNRQPTVTYDAPPPQYPPGYTPKAQQHNNIQQSVTYQRKASSVDIQQKAKQKNGRNRYYTGNASNGGNNGSSGPNGGNAGGVTQRGNIGNASNAGNGNNRGTRVSGNKDGNGVVRQIDGTFDVLDDDESVTNDIELEDNDIFINVSL